MFCCPKCFSDAFLIAEIKSISRQHDSCGFCQTTDVEVIEASSLYDYFAPIIDIYEADSDGMELASILQSDWGIFGALNANQRTRLLTEITGNAELPSTLYKCQIEHDKNQLVRWQEFREELKHQNRYFPTLIPDQDHLQNLFDLLAIPVNVPAKLFRARINRIDGPLPVEEMGVPPREYTSNGRANPKGIAYLYTATNEETAISEVRPFVGERVTVAEFEVLDPLALVDLRDPKKSISPFMLSEDDLGNIYRDMPFLILLGDELSRPVIPQVAELEYLPSQYLCEFVKHIGFDGITYRSSLAGGNNVAVFDGSKLKAVRTTEFKVDSIRINYSHT